MEESQNNFISRETPSYGYLYRGGKKGTLLAHGYDATITYRRKRIPAIFRKICGIFHGILKRFNYF